MKNALGLKCVGCAREYQMSHEIYVCESCGNNLDVIYDYSYVGARLTKESLSSNADRSIWRYRPLLPIEDSSPVPPLFIGWTPLYNSAKLANEHSIKALYIKDDGRNPTASFKDRASAVAVVKAQEARAQAITCASSGNAASALAGICASVGMKNYIFVPASTPRGKIAQLMIYRANIFLVEGPYDEAFDLCLQASQRFGWYQRNTGYNPYTIEGKKTAALEICEQLNWHAPDKVIVPVGDGNIISGLWKGFNDLYQLKFIDRLPQMMAVQAEGACSIVNAVNSDGVLREMEANTIADSIAVGKSRDGLRAVRAIRDSGGMGIKVSDAEILQAIGALARATGIFAEPAAAASYAAFLKLSQSAAFRSDETVLLLITGNGLKDVDSILRDSTEPPRIKANIEEVEALIARSAT